MKKILLLLLGFALFVGACSKECTESLGAIVQQEVEVEHFDKIIVNSGISLVIKQNENQKVIVKTGENKLDNVHVLVENGTLSIEADPLCITSPDLDPVTVIINSPNICSIRNASEYSIVSDGVLIYPNLNLISENYNSDYLNIGNFDLEIDSEKLTVVSNNITNIKVKGHVNELKLGYFSGIGKFEGRELIAEKVSMHHRGENTLFVNPQQELIGDIFSIGDVFSYNHPPVVSVIEHYEGELHFVEN